MSKTLSKWGKKKERKKKQNQERSRVSDECNIITEGVTDVHTLEYQKGEERENDKEEILEAIMTENFPQI